MEKLEGLSMQKILVTGADGFIGSHLTEMLVRRGYGVKALSLYNSFNHWGWLEEVDCIGQIEVLNGDVRDPHYCRSILEDVDVVYHLAALIAIPYSYVAPDSYVDTNIKGTLNICQAALEHGAQRLDQRGLWHRPVRADRRVASPAAAIAVQRDQDRRGRDRDELSQCLPTARDRGPPLQHFRTAAVRAGGDSDHDHPDRQRHPQDPAWRSQADP